MILYDAKLSYIVVVLQAGVPSHLAIGLPKRVRRDRGAKAAKKAATMSKEAELKSKP